MGQGLHEPGLQETLLGLRARFGSRTIVRGTPGEVERAVGEPEPEVAVLENDAVLIAENREQHLLPREGGDIELGEIERLRERYAPDRRVTCVRLAVGEREAEAALAHATPETSDVLLLRRPSGEHPIIR